MCVPKSKWAFEPMSSLKKSVIFFSIPNYALKLKLAKKRIFKNPVFFLEGGLGMTMISWRGRVTLSIV